MVAPLSQSGLTGRALVTFNCLANIKIYKEVEGDKFRLKTLFNKEMLCILFVLTEATYYEYTL